MFCCYNVSIYDTWHQRQLFIIAKVLVLSLQMVTRAKVQNYLVVAIDEKLRDYLVSKGYNIYFKDISVSTAAVVMHLSLSANHLALSTLLCYQAKQVNNSSHCSLWLSL